MKLAFASREFDEAVAAVCHGLASDEQARALNELLRSDAAARDEYILRVELHSRLASEPDLFVVEERAGVSKSSEPTEAASEFSPSLLHGERGGNVIERRRQTRVIGVTTPHPQFLSPWRGEGGRRAALRWTVALATCVALLATGWWMLRTSQPSEQSETTERTGTTSKAVAMLDRTADAQWNGRGEIPRLGAPLEPGWLRLEAGLAQVVFYSGARLVVEGPAELQLISQSEASLRRGRIIAEIPPGARGFRIGTPHTVVTDLGTSFGLDVKEPRTELHVFNGKVKLRTGANAAEQTLQEGSGALIRNFSGAMDEFCVFSRALNVREVRALYSQGKPQVDAVATRVQP